MIRQMLGRSLEPVLVLCRVLVSGRKVNISWEVYVRPLRWKQGGFARP